MFKKPTEKKIPDAFSRYQDPTGEFTNRDLRLGEWYITHRIMLREIVVTLLAIIIVVFGGYTLYRLIEYTFFGYSHDERVRNELTKTSIPLKTLRSDAMATALVIDSVSLYPSTPGKYDFVAMVTNSNERWIARVSYVFVWDGGETEPNTSLVLPGKSMPLATIGVPVSGLTDNVRLVIKNIDWQRLDNHKYPDWSGFVVEHNNFAVTDLVFSPASAGSVSRIIFMVKNNTPFGFWQVPCVVVLKKGESVVGVKRIIIDSFVQNSARLVELTSLSESIDVDLVEIYPDLDILDSDIYLEPML